LATVKEVLAVAQGEIGVKESPAGSNTVKYNTEYYGYKVAGDNFPWCCVFVWWVFKHADASRLFFDGRKTEGCPALFDYYKANGQLVTEPRAGDIVFFDFSGKKTRKQHVGIVERVSGNVLTTIEGNTGAGNDANGGMVMRRTRDISLVSGIARPSYEQEVIKVADKDNTASGWAQEAVQWMQDNDLLHGDDEGNLLLHSAMTREQFCVFLYRFYQKFGK
jgi:hypothetical protein